MKPSMKQKIRFGMLALVASLASNGIVYAQGDKTGGGGNLTEADLQYYINKLDIYLLSNEGKQTFPEIVNHDRAYPEKTFHQIIREIRPVVQKGELRDSLGKVRDCVSYIGQGYFVCNSDALPEKTLDNQPSFYRIVFHELLVQAGIEKPISQNIPSEYPISSRITENVHLETYREWVPGKEKNRCGVRVKVRDQYQGLLQSDFKNDRIPIEAMEILNLLIEKNYSLIEGEGPTAYTLELALNHLTTKGWYQVDAVFKSSEAILALSSERAKTLFFMPENSNGFRKLRARAFKKVTQSLQATLKACQ